MSLEGSDPQLLIGVYFLTALVFLLLGMPSIISFVSRKGGTGKTTNAINLSTTLHHMGKRMVSATILPVMVPQRNLFVNFSTVNAEHAYQPIAQAIE